MHNTTSQSDESLPFRFTFKAATERMREHGMLAMMTVHVILNGEDEVRLNDTIIRKNSRGLWLCPPAREFKSEDGSKRRIHYYEIFPALSHSRGKSDVAKARQKEYEDAAMSAYRTWLRSGDDEHGQARNGSDNEFVPQNKEVAHQKTPRYGPHGRPRPWTGPVDPLGQPEIEFQDPDLVANSTPYEPLAFPEDPSRYGDEDVALQESAIAHDPRDARIAELERVVREMRTQDPQSSELAEGGQAEAVDPPATAGAAMPSDPQWNLPDFLKPPIPKRG